MKGNMAASCKQCFSLLPLKNTNRLRWRESFRTYAQFPKLYQEPIINKEEIEKLLQSTEKSVISEIPRLPPANADTCSVFHDDFKNKFINYLMRRGEKEKARKLFEDVLTSIKHLQIRKYNKETDEEKRNAIVLDPMEVFRTAVKNATPMLKVINIKKSGSWYRVPAAVSEKQAQFIAMKWIIQSSKLHYEIMPYKQQLLSEILNASKGEGKAVQKKIELHKLCEANRGYAHYKWT